MLPRDVLQNNRDRIRQVVASHRAGNPRVFGSVLRGEDREGSDLDVLVDPLPGITLFDLGAIQVELEEALGIPVDVVTPGDLPPRLRAKVLGEAVTI